MCLTCLVLRVQHRLTPIYSIYRQESQQLQFSSSADMYALTIYCHNVLNGVHTHTHASCKGDCNLKCHTYILYVLYSMLSNVCLWTSWKLCINSTMGITCCSKQGINPSSQYKSHRGKSVFALYSIHVNVFAQPIVGIACNSHGGCILHTTPAAKPSLYTTTIMRICNWVNLLSH